MDYIPKTRDLRVNFKGNNNKPFAFIVNVIHSKETRIGHWVAISVNNQFPHCRKIIVRYFDSFGDSYLTYKAIATYIHNIKKLCQMHNYIFVLDTSKRVIQYYDSMLCGLYTAYFVCLVFQHCDSLSISNIFKHFKKDKRANDARVLRFLEYNYPAKSCNHYEDVYGGRKASLEQLIKVPTPFCPKLTFGLKKCFKHIKCDCQGP